MKVLIVGAGIHGLALAWALIRGGRHEVTLLDRWDIPNTLNASYDQHRLIHDFGRRSVGRLPSITEAFAAWDELALCIGPLHVRTGAVHVYRGEPRAICTAHRLQQEGIECQVVRRTTLADMLPGFSPHKDDCGVGTTRGGILHADRIAHSLVGWLTEHGVTIRARTPIVSLDVDGVAALTGDGGRLPADAIVVAAGPRLGSLIPDLMPRLGVRRQVMVYFELPGDLDAAWRASPVFLGVGGGDELWGAPPVAGTNLKFAAGCLATAVPVALVDDSRLARPEDAAMLLAHCQQHFPDIAATTVLRVAVCFYPTTCDHELVMEPLDGDRSAVWFLSGGDGGDYKFAPAIALRLAECLSAGSTSTAVQG